jgi:hypothetical protein
MCGDAKHQDHGVVGRYSWEWGSSGRFASMGTPPTVSPGGRCGTKNLDPSQGGRVYILDATIAIRI